jgi:hypothetical protein
MAGELILDGELGLRIASAIRAGGDAALLCVRRIVTGV